ncbi:MATE family efflux transporter [Ruminococcaceae bacterium OttesenSCG-928-A16]|nr:MATE family efflux transporter [Ruminococcaceae bacterium OttesenSCG-928-A16]
MNRPQLATEQWNNRALLRLIWPLMIEQLLAVTLGMVDTVMVTTVGEAAVSGVSLSDSVNVLLINLFAALATGGAVVASQYLGRGNQKNASEAGRQLVYSITILSCVVGVVAFVLRGQLLSLIYGDLDPLVRQNAEVYLWISSLSYPFIGLYNAGAALFRSMGNSRVSMLTSLLVNLLNIAGNSLLIYGFGWGVAGSAISTLVSRAIAAMLLLWLLAKGKNPISLAGLLRVRLDFGMIRNILKIGLPGGLENSIFQIGKLLTAGVVSAFGTAAIAGNAITGVLATFGNLPGGAISLALITVVGQCVGAGDYEGAKKYTRKLMIIAFTGMGVLNLAIAASAGVILPLFRLSAEGAAIAYQCLMFNCFSAIVFWPQSFSLPNALRAAGDAKFTMAVSIFSMWVFRVGLAFLFAFTLNLGVLGVWFAMVVDWAIRGIIFIWRWKSGRWQNKMVLQ